MLHEAPLSAESRVLEMRVYWGTILLDIAHHRRPKTITIGETKRTDVFIASEGLPTDEFPLIRTIDDEYVLTFTDAMDGELELGGNVQALATLDTHADASLEGARCISLPTDARAIVHWGGITFALRFVPPVQASPNRFWNDLDFQSANVLVASLFIHLAVIVTLLVAPRDADSLREDIFSTQCRLLLTPPKVTERVVKTLTELRRTPVTHSPTHGTVAAKQGAALERIRTLFTANTNLLGGTSISAKLADVIGTVRPGPGSGLMSLGTRGGLPGAGPPGTSRGITQIGMIGRLGAPSMGPLLLAHKERDFASLSTPLVVGALPREVIQRVINDNKAQIRYCYEIELQRDQSLAGKVAMKWVIGATGAVTQVVVAESTLQTTRVGRCLTEKIKSWRFPQPAGGGVVEVNYPFVFTSR